MPAIKASAPGKVILFGEHAVVYNRPALAVPVKQVQAQAYILANPRGKSQIEAPDIGFKGDLDVLPAGHPLVLAIEGVRSALGLDHLPAFRLKITSTIPIASGLGSGAAVSVAIARAVSAFLGQPLPDEKISQIAFRVDQTHHGTPSGIDNTVIAYAQPVWFVRGQPFERFHCAAPFTLIIADTGLASPTGLVVGDVRRRWLENPSAIEPLFNRIGAIVREARGLIEIGRPEELGPLMLANHAILQTLDVSSPELDRLVDCAQREGALGAKLCGGGRGGNMIALVRPDKAGAIAAALCQAGAKRTIITQVA
jgi:mevalonate kinase